MNTWGIPKQTNNMTRSCFSTFFLYMYLSYIFYFKESTFVTREKQKANKDNKKIYRRVEGKPLPIVFDYVLLIRQSSTFSFFFLSQLVLKLYPYLVPFTIKGRELTRSFSYWFTSFFLLLLAKNSLSSSSLIWIYQF